MEQKLSDTLVKAIDRSNPMMQNLQLASRFNKLVEQSGGGIVAEPLAVTENGVYTAPSGKAYSPVTVNVPSGGEDKLLCYYSDSQDPKGRIVYTDKPATQMHIDTDGDYENSIPPIDEGKHLFMTSLATGGYGLKSINLIYEDGSRSENLKDKFVKI